MANASLTRLSLALIFMPILSLAARAAPQTIPLSTFRVQVAAAQQLVSACGATAAACDAHTVPQDAEVKGERAAAGFHAGWQWLHDAVEQAAKVPAAERSVAMTAAAGHLNELAAEVAAQAAGVTSDSAAARSLPAAHAAAARILARDEFRADAGPTWLDRQIARLQDALLRLFLGMARVGTRNAWVAPLIEWLCFGLAAAGLLLFIRRSLNRQALRISLAASAPPTGKTGRSSAEWLRDADAAEAAGNGRETIHCLYWAAVASLETRKAWRPNPTRTPREYLPLLRAGSGTQATLRSLTRQLERTWYGSAEPTQAEVQAARNNLSALQTGSLGRDAQSREAQGREAQNQSTHPAAAASIPSGTAG